MYILALESSGISGSIAVSGEGSLLEERALDPHKGSAQTLVPGIQALLGDLGIQMRNIGLVAVNLGPGSFTGLRIGVATAKTLAYGLCIPCIGVDGFTVVAEQATCKADRLSVAIDAQRGEVFYSDFSRSSGVISAGSQAGQQTIVPRVEEAQPPEVSQNRWQRATGPGILPSRMWVDRLQTATAVSGPALSRILNDVAQGVEIVRPALWWPKAATIAALAWRRHLGGAYDDAWKLSPLYIRRSAAEEKLETPSFAR
jgi:tRNA threonylcarbamoyladenosine biosynthesis protein TsaB